MLPYKLLYVLGILFCSSVSVLCQSVDLRSISEGLCPHVGFPIQGTRSINQTWFATAPFRYILGGSRYHLYRISTGSRIGLGYTYSVPVREDNFAQTACIQTSINIPLKRATIFSKGQPVNEYILSRPNPQEYGIIDFVPTHYPGELDVPRHYITWTDNRSFVVFANCWMGSNQKSWVVMTIDPFLPLDTVREIEYHIQTLGFDRRLSVFLRHDRCNRFS